MKKEEIFVDLSTGPDPLPKAGDMVNYVQAGNKIIPAKVVSVIDKTEGRAITVASPDPKATGPLHITHRPKAALAGNTWHWPAKAAAMLLLLLTVTLSVLAAIPTYRTFGPYGGNSSSVCTAMLPADPNSQSRDGGRSQRPAHATVGQGTRRCPRRGRPPPGSCHQGQKRCRL